MWDLCHEMLFARRIGDRLICMDQSRFVEDFSKDNFYTDPKERSARVKDFTSIVLVNSVSELLVLTWAVCPLVPSG